MATTRPPSTNVRFNGSGRVLPNNQVPSISTQASQADNNAKKKKFSQRDKVRSFSKFVKRWVKAYAGALVVNSTAVPIFASAVTLCLGMVQTNVTIERLGGLMRIA